MVRILVFVDVDVLELVLVFFQHFGRAFKQVDRLHDQIVKIERVVLPQRFLVRFIHFRGGFFVAGFVLPKRLFRGDQLVFHVAYMSQKRARRI